MAKLVKIPRQLQNQIAAWERLAKADSTKLVLDAGEVVAKAAIAEIQERASWGPTPRWAHVAKYLEPGRSDDNVVVWIPPTEPEGREGYDLEYGTEDRPPVPIMHNALTQARRKHNALFSTTLATNLLQRGRR